MKNKKPDDLELKALQVIEEATWEPDTSILSEEEQKFLDDFAERFYSGYYKQEQNERQLFRDGRRFKAIMATLRKHRDELKR